MDKSKKIIILLVAVTIFVATPMFRTAQLNVPTYDNPLVMAQETTPTAPTSNPNIDTNVTNVNFRLPVIGFIIGAVLLIINSVVGLVTGTAVYVLMILIKFNIGLTDSSFNIIATTGWDVFRQIANLGFVLGIIVIAIATILRNRSYSAQQILWKLIAAALLVNFSLVIAGSFIQVSNVFSGYFISSIEGKSFSLDPNNPDSNLILGSMAKTITGTIGITSLNKADALNDLANSSNVGMWKLMTSAVMGPSIGMIITLLFSTTVMVVVFITLLALVVTVFYRFFFLSALLTISPIVWLLWVFPFGTRWWREWWQHYLKWVFMLPINLLFIWLALKVMQTGLQAKVTSITNSFSTDKPLTGFEDLGAMVSSMTAAALLIMGLKLSMKLGIAGSDLAVKWSKKAGGAVRGAAGKYGKRAGARAYTGTGLAGQMQKGLTKVGSWKVGRALGIGKAAQRHAEAVAGAEKTARAFVDEKVDQYKTLGVDRTEALIGTMTSREREAAAIYLAREEKLGKSGIVEKLGNGNREQGEEALLSIAERRKSEGDKKTADSIYTGVGKNREIRDAQAELNRHTDRIKEHNEVLEEYNKPAGELAEVQNSIEDKKREVEQARKEYEEAIKTVDLGGVKEKAFKDKQVELTTLEAKVAPLEAVVAPIKARLDPLEKELEPFKESLRSARSKFNNEYKKVEEQRKIGKAVFSKSEEDITMTPAERIDRINQAEFINSDTSGSRYFSVYSSLDSDKQTNLLQSLVLAATKQTQMSGELKDEFEKAFTKGGGSISNLIGVMKKSGARDQNLLKRLETQMNKSMAGDLGTSEFGSRPIVITEGGGGEKPKEPAK